MARYALFLIVLAIPACTKPGTPTSADSAGSAGSADSWKSATPSITIGDIKVSITQAGIEPIHVSGVQNHTEIFAIRLSISNISSSKRFNYRTWADDATLVDNFDNRYKLLSRPRGMGVQSASLDPATPVSDILLFETPIKTAGSVQLQLPAGNVDQRGYFTLHINLHSTGARLDAVTSAAAAVAAEHKAKSDAIAFKEAEARRKESEARRVETQEQRAFEMAVAEKKRAAEVEAEKARLAAEAKQRADAVEAEKARPAAEAKRKADEAQAEKVRLEEEEKKRIADRAAKIATLSNQLAATKKRKEKTELDLNAVKDSQFLSTAKKFQKELDILIAECLKLEAEIKSLNK